jgi:glutathione S-transferase
MKLYHSPASPYVRKVMVVAQEAGLLDRIEVATVTTTPMAPDAAVAAANPVKKIPALVTDDGMALFDSPVICEYLDSLNSGRKLFPDGKARWEALCLQAAADGLLGHGGDVVVVAHFGAILSQVQRALAITPAEALAQALESTLLAVLLVWIVRQGRRRRQHRRTGFDAVQVRAIRMFGWAYTAAFIYTFSGIAYNLGLISRQRAQLWMPLLLVLAAALVRTDRRAPSGPTPERSEPFAGR